jgi:drug/metabolite transporter (DMT)-like permease
MSSSPHPPRALLVLAFGALYLVWGSTYLAIRWAVEELPPFLLAGSRHVLAALAIASTLAFWRTPPGSRAQALRALGIGVLLLGCSNGGVVWAEQRVPSGLAALLVSLVTVWMTLAECVLERRARPSRGLVAGLALGLSGVAILAAPWEAAGEPIDPLGLAVLLFATLSWTAGSMIARRSDLPASSWVTSAWEMLGGGLALLAVAAFTGELGEPGFAAASPRAVGSWAYLVVLGSIVGMSAYTWLLKVSTPSKVTTYAFVNPVVAVGLGWLLANEPLTPRVLSASALILLGVILIVRERGRTAAQPAQPEPSARSASATAQRPLQAERTGR